MLTLEEKEGVIGYSPLMDYPGFDFIKGVPVDWMHQICIGVIKKMLPLTFQVGDTKRRATKRKLSSPKLFNDIMQKQKVPKEFSRRGRNLDLKVMKAEEFRNLILFFFPIILACIDGQSDTNERNLWLVMAFQIRAYVLPDTEYENVCQIQLEYCCNRFLTLFEEIYGARHASYNVHMMCHLKQVRERGPLTNTSTFATESYYSEMRRSYVAGTASTGKQLLQNAFIKRQLPHRKCHKNIIYHPKDTRMSCNKYFYVFQNNAYTFYIIKEICDDGAYKCVRQGRRQYKPAENSHLNWESVGVFLISAIDESEEKKFYKNEITGKAIVVMNFIITCPSNVLKE